MLVVVDQATVARGDEPGVVQAAGAFLDRLGLDDRIAVLRIPMSSDVQVALTTERPPLREVLSRVAGQAAPAPAFADLTIQPPRDAVVDPDRQATGDPEKAVRTERPDPAGLSRAAEAPSDVDPRAVHDSLAALRAMFGALRQIPGRKVVALFSAGLPARASLQVNDTAIAATAADAVVYAFGVRSPRSEAPDPPDTASLERLAVLTGGAFVALGKNPERLLERAVNELSACYVLGLEPAPSDGDRARHTSPRGDHQERGDDRGAAWLVRVPDAGDQAPPLAAPVVAPEVAPESSPPPKRAEAPPAGTRERDRELQLALARLYQGTPTATSGRTSMLVAEEDYRQTASKGGIRLRSDVLLVRPETTDQWVSFRDVFEVDGRPVRDREERLRRLFLDPTPDALARLEAIRDESARYNVGPVERTINVPLFPLVFLRPANRFRLDFQLTGQDEVAGVRGWRIRYVEQARPTMVSDLQNRDVPVTGWFFVDTMTGAVVETGMTVSRDGSRAEIIVRYRRDPALGLWVPAEMREIYTEASYRSPIGNAVIMEGRATYSNFRRFQVRTEEKITIPK